MLMCVTYSHTVQMEVMRTIVKSGTVQKINGSAQLHLSALTQIIFVMTMQIVQIEVMNMAVKTKLALMRSGIVMVSVFPIILFVIVIHFALMDLMKCTVRSISVDMGDGSVTICVYKKSISVMELVCPQYLELMRCVVRNMTVGWTTGNVRTVRSA